MKKLTNFINIFAQAVSLDGSAPPTDTDNYRSDITNTLFISKDDKNTDSYDPIYNQNIGKNLATIPTNTNQRIDILNSLVKKDQKK